LKAFILLTSITESLHPCASVIKHYNLVVAKGQPRSVTGESGITLAVCHRVSGVSAYVLSFSTLPMIRRGMTVFSFLNSLNTFLTNIGCM